MTRTILAVFFGLFVAVSGLSLHAQESLFSGRPGLTEAERPPSMIATCETLEAALKGFRAPQRRVDLWVSGPLTIVHTDGALWYLVICSKPDVQVMCVTYSDNEMKPGERVILRGAFEQLDPRHVRLDPCLATRS